MAVVSNSHHRLKNRILRLLASLSSYLPLGTRTPEPRSILVVRLGNVGDLVVAIPAFHAMRQAWPEAKITLLTSPTKRGAPGAVEVLQNDSVFDDMIVYYEDESSRPGFLVELIGKLRQKKIDTLVILPNHLAGAMNVVKFVLLAALIGARRIHGAQLPIARDYERPQVDRLMDIVVRVGAPSNIKPFPWLTPSEADIAKADDLLSRCKSGLLIGMHCGAKRPANRWPTRHFIELGRLLRERLGATIVLTGSGGEKELTQQVATAIGDGCLDLAGQTNIGELAAVIRKCDLFISNDTGVMHVAYAAGTRVLAVFGGRFYEHIWYPYGAGHTVIRKEIECSPCHADACPLYDEPECLARISPEEVFEEAKRMLT